LSILDFFWGGSFTILDVNDDELIYYCQKFITKLSPISIFALALIIGLVTVFAIDPLDMSTVSTPFCLGIILMALSLRQGTSVVVAVSFLYTILTVYALIRFHQYYAAHIHASAHPYFWLFQRVGLFLVLCGMAIYLAHYRTDTDRILTRLRTILAKLPAPVILSNASGHIVYANDAVVPILHQTADELTGRSYFDFLLTDKTKGKSIRSYFELFEMETNGIFELEISPFGDAHRLNAQLICLGTGQNRVMITVLQGVDKLFEQPLPS
jgi:PAS domain-containing protein